MRALIIDDDTNILAVCEHMLRECGYEVSVAQDGHAGLDKINADKNFDVLLTDVLMPGCDGLEVIRKLREDYPMLWVIAMSGGGANVSGKFSLSASAAFGADRTLSKPFFESDLKAALPKH
jgi:CheY-like chemotaxis protein